MVCFALLPKDLSIFYLFLDYFFIIPSSSTKKIQNNLNIHNILHIFISTSKNY